MSGCGSGRGSHESSGCHIRDTRRAVEAALATLDRGLTTYWTAKFVNTDGTALSLQIDKRKQRLHGPLSAYLIIRTIQLVF